MWLTPAFASRGVSTTGVLWAITRVLSLLTVAAFETVSWNAFLHVVMVAGVFSLLLAPQLERWVNHHVMGG
jgi:Na+/H+ antiporter NhaA